jgi:hypothetical protein
MKSPVRMFIGLVVASFSAGSIAAQQPKVPTPGTYDGGYLVFASADSAFMYWLDGRVQVDGCDGSRSIIGLGHRSRSPLD